MDLLKVVRADTEKKDRGNMKKIMQINRVNEPLIRQVPLSKELIEAGEDSKDKIPFETVHGLGLNLSLLEELKPIRDAGNSEEKTRNVYSPNRTYLLSGLNSRLNSESRSA